MPEQIRRVHHRSILRRRQGRPALHPLRPQRQHLPHRDRRRPVRPIAQREARHHPPQRSPCIRRIAVAIRPVNRQPIRRPRHDRRMLRHRRRALGVAVCPRIVVHMIPELKAQPDRVRVVVVVIPRLMRERRVKGDAFIVIPIPVPNPVAGQPIRRRRIRRTRIAVGKRIPAVEHRHPIHHPPRRTQPGQRLHRRDRWHPRDAVSARRVRREIREVRCLRRIQIPRPHHVTREPRRLDVNPARRVGDLVHIRIDRTRLRPRAPAPRRRLHPRRQRLIRRALVNARVLAGIPREPRCELGVRQGGRRGER